MASLLKPLRTRCILVIFVGLISFQFGNAQVSGYLGKRLSVCGNFDFMPTVRGLELRLLDGIAISNEGIGVDFNWGYGIDLAYALTRKLSVRAGIGRFHTNMEMDSKGLLYSVIFNETYVVDYTYLYDLTALTYRVGFDWSRLKRGGLGPMGPYFGMHADFHNITGMETDKYPTEDIGIIGLIDTPLEFDTKSKYWDLKFELGFNNILYDRLILKSAFQFGWSTRGRYYTTNPSNNYQTEFTVQTYKVYNEEKFDERSIARGFTHQMMMIRVGLGYLIF
ncbi:MAG: hypothetical protein KDC34_19980 [Saprospiraceae bacterium]|nr:hypothetical protein [Saprospiraceae bacterium]